MFIHVAPRIPTRPSECPVVWAACVVSFVACMGCVRCVVCGLRGLRACLSVCVCVCLCVGLCVCVDVRVLCTCVLVPFVLPFGFEYASLKVPLGVSTLWFERFFCSRVL